MNTFYDYYDHVEQNISELQNDPSSDKNLLASFIKSKDEMLDPFLEKVQSLQQKYEEMMSVLGRRPPVNVSENPNPPTEYPALRFEEPTESLPMTSQMDPSIVATKMSVSTAGPSVVRRYVAIDEDEKNKYINSLKALLSNSSSLRDTVMNALVSEFIKGNISKDDFEIFKKEFESYNVKKNHDVY